MNKSNQNKFKGIRSKELLYLHPSSLMNAVFPSWVMYSEVVKTGKYYMNQVSELDYRWLLEIAPHFYEDNTQKMIEEKHIKEIESQQKFEQEKFTEIQKPSIQKEQVMFGKFKQPSLPKTTEKKPFKQNASMLSFDCDF